MRHLFEAEGLQALQSVVRLRPLLAFDFDGTLAPIVAHPDDAKVSTVIGRHLRRLALRAPVAIVTGRSVDDVLPRLGFTLRYVVGNHGAEDLQGLLSRLRGTALHELRCHLEAQREQLQAVGVQVEDKRHSLALHYRLAHDQGSARERIEALLHGLAPSLKAFGGKCVVNVVASDAPDKGDAVHSLVERCGAAAAIFVGDDLNDEAVFIRAAPHWLTVRIGRDDAQSRAMFFLDSHAEVASLLERLQGLLEASRARP